MQFSVIGFRRSVHDHGILSQDSRFNVARESCDRKERTHEKCESCVGTVAQFASYFLRVMTCVLYPVLELRVLALVLEYLYCTSTLCGCLVLVQVLVQVPILVLCCRETLKMASVLSCVRWIWVVSCQMKFYVCAII